MIEELSAGGVVFFRNTILLLKKFNGDYVLPKGRVEQGETLETAAVREVFEESGAKADIIKYLSKISYEFIRNTNENNIRIKKVVHWFIMEAKDMECRPQKSEGFIEADYYTLKNAVKLARYDDERSVIEKAVEEKSNIDFKWN